MRVRFQFRLRKLLLCTSVLCVLLAYSRWRRLWMLDEVAALRTEGVQVWGIRDEWRDKIWLRAPYGAYIHCAEVSPTERRLGNMTYEYLKGEGIEHYQALEQRCYALGIKHVEIGWIGTSEERLERFMNSKDGEL